MRVLLISHTYFPSHYRGKLRWLATEGGVNSILAALRERLAHLLAHPKERERLAQAGKQRAGQRFTDQAIGRQTLQFYRQIMEAG